jgi:PAS domain S-box-containing protein
MSFSINSDEVQEIIALCDADGILQDWNAAGKEITGFSSEDLIGYHLDSILSEESRKRLGEILSLRRQGTILPGMPLRLLTNYGMEVPVEVTSIPRTRKGKFDGWLLVFRDATIKVQLQEQLDKLDLLYRTLVESSPAIIYVLDSSGRLVFINDTVESLLGFPKSELIGKEITEFVHPEDRDRAYWPLRERRRFPRATQNCEFRFITRAGTQRRFDLDYIYVSLNAIGLQANANIRESPNALGTQGIARDITELVMCREFSRQVGVILPICSVCHKIRVTVNGGDEWMTLDSYISGKTDTRFSHTFCPEHKPREY